jgi:hypothetical protein
MESIVERRDRGHFISLLFGCRLLGPLDERRRAGGTLSPGMWRWHAKPPADLLDVHRPYARFLE